MSQTSRKVNCSKHSTICSEYIFTSSELNLAYRNQTLKFFKELYYESSNLEMKDCYYIGDRLEIDAIISSTAAGMQGYG